MLFLFFLTPFFDACFPRVMNLFLLYMFPQVLGQLFKCHCHRGGKRKHFQRGEIDSEIHKEVRTDDYRMNPHRVVRG